MAQKQSSNKIFGDLIFNIIIPSLILSKGPAFFGHAGGLIALVLALIFPVAYGLYDYKTAGKKNILTIIGVINVLMTGGLALLHIEGQWFAVKEAAFPLVIGIAVCISAFGKRPFIEKIIYQDHVFQVEKIQTQLQLLGKEKDFHILMKRTTLLFSLSFLASAILNFGLAIRIFQPIALQLSADERAHILNEQIAQMNWKSYLVIALPMLLMTFFILAYLVKGLKSLTQLGLTELLVNNTDTPETPAEKNKA
jgi:hypothetical protein